MLRLVVSIGLAVSAALLFTNAPGCNRVTDDLPSSEGGEPAEQIVAKMVERYAECDSYQDNATLRLSYRLQGQPFHESHPYQTQWQRKQAYFARWFKSRIVGDSSQLVCRVVDIPTNNMDRQVVFQTPGSVGTFDAIFEDSIAKHFICGTSDLPWAPDVQENPNDQIPPVWSLLTSEHKPLWLRSHSGLKKLDAKELGDRTCYRIAVDTLLGEYVAWIDSGDYLLRRLEIPEGVMARELNQTEEVSNIEIAVDFTDAKLNVPPNDHPYGMQTADDEQATRYFVKLPETFPTDLIGKRVRDFQLHALRGRDLTRDELKDRIAVLLWFSGQNGAEACKAFNEVTRRFVEFDDVVCFGVCTDPNSMADDQAVGSLANYWNMNYAVTRDLQPVGETVFDIDVVPTVVILGPDSRLQYHASADSGDLVSDTIAAIDRLKQGDDIATEMRQQYDDYVATYKRQLIAADPFRQSDSVETVEVKLRKRSFPTRLQMTRLWTSQELVAAGNVMITASPDGGQSEVYAHDGWRTIVRLNESGETIARYPLDLPDSTGVSWTRSGISDSRRVFAASSMMEKQVFVFDDRWRKTFSYPMEPDSNNGIADVRFIDSDRVTPARLLVAFSDGGVHMVDLDGRLLARSEPIKVAQSLALHYTDKLELEMIIGTKSGDAVWLDKDLQRIPNRFPRDTRNFQVLPGTIDARNSADASRSYLALGEHDEVALSVSVLDADLRPVGNAELAPGVFREQVQFAVFDDALEDASGQWFVARPDSSIHVISANGKLIDSFRHGKSIRGIDVASTREGGMLVISTSDGVEAFRIGTRGQAAARLNDPDQR